MNITEFKAARERRLLETENAWTKSVSENNADTDLDNILDTVGVRPTLGGRR